MLKNIIIFSLGNRQPNISLSETKVRIAFTWLWEGWLRAGR